MKGASGVPIKVPFLDQGKCLLVYKCLLGGVY